MERIVKEMKYNSTTDKNIVVSASQAIAQGISTDGGLFVPQEIPQYSLADIESFTIHWRERKRGAGLQPAESGLYRPDPEPDLDNANVGK